MKAGWVRVLAILSSAACVEPAYQRCVENGHCRTAQQMDSGIDAGLDAGPDLVSGLVGHWKLDETNPVMVVADSSGFGHHGRVEGVVRYVPGKIGNAMDVDGRGGVVIKSTSQITDLQLMSFAVWLNVRNFPQFVEAGMAQPRIIDKIGFALAVCVDPRCSQTLAYANDTTKGNHQWRAENFILPLPDAGTPSEHWQHFAVVHDRRRVENEPQFFLNGVPIRGEQLDFVDGGTFISDVGHPITLGYRLNTARWLNGQLDDVRLYNRLLIASEVEALFRLAQ